MLEKIIKTERVRQGNKIIETTVKELPLYSVSKTQANYWWEDGEFEDYLLNLKVICYSKTYEGLNNTSFTSDSDSASDVLKEFTEYIASNFSGYNVYVLQEYKHSGSVFHLTETTDRIDRWDSSIVGFMALPKNVDSQHLANEITDVYEGTIDVFDIVNNETNDVELSYERWLYTTTLKEWQDMCKEAQENYDVDLELADKGGF